MKPNPLLILTALVFAAPVYAQVELYPVPGATTGVAWGNGTNAEVAYYEPLFRELNKQGVSVAAATTGSAWSGEEIAFAGEVLADLGCEWIVAAGHSQGAGGALRAARDNPDLFDAVCPIMPAAKLEWYGDQPCFLPIGQYDLRSVKEGSAYTASVYPGWLLYAERKGIGHYRTDDAELCRRVAEFAAKGYPRLSTRYWRIK